MLLREALSPALWCEDFENDAENGCQLENDAAESTVLLREQCELENSELSE